MRDRTGPKNPNWRGGKSSHPLYGTWCEMRHRCRNPQHKRFADYGGRGITVCQRWSQDFWAFVSDMGPKPVGYLLDRVDNDAGYSPGNCRWATPSESNRNRRSNGKRPWRHFGDLSGLAHGRTHTYKMGCRCAECRASVAAARRAWKRRRKARVQGQAA